MILSDWNEHKSLKCEASNVCEGHCHNFLDESGYKVKFLIEI